VVAASVVYLAPLKNNHNQIITQTNIANAAGITEVTIRNIE
jgi:transcription initiation factor TFIIIB Brf1 subunit/transcription initiation factor TFIIB